MPAPTSLPSANHPSYTARGLGPAEFRNHLGRALARWRERSRSIAVVMIGLHPAYGLGSNPGSATESHVRSLLGQRLLSMLYESDVITMLDTGEYVVICQDVAGKEEASAIAHRLAGEVSRPVHLDDGLVFPVVRTGVVLGSSTSTADDMLWDAAKAMHHSSGGDNEVIVFDEHFRAELMERFDASNAIACTQSNEHLELRYQPILAVSGADRLAVEALIRPKPTWSGPTDPERIVAIAEESGRMSVLGDWVLRTAIDQATRWPEYAGRAVVTHINLSPVQLRNPLLIQTIEHTLDDCCVEASLVSLEVTESAPLDPSDRRVLYRIKEMGLGVCLDDFGKGFSNLGSLRDLPIDAVKLDRSLVKDVDTNKASRAIAGAVVTMAHSLGLEVVAEGIETSVQLETVIDLGVDQVQGFWIGGAMPADRLSQLAIGRTA